MNGVDYSASIMVRPTSMPRFVRVRWLEKMKREERLQRRIDLYRQRRDKETEEERQGEVHSLCREVSTVRHSTQVKIQDSLSQHIISSVKMCVKC